MKLGLDELSAVVAIAVAVALLREVPRLKSPEEVKRYAAPLLSNAGQNAAAAMACDSPTAAARTSSLAR
jgi:hypothetical protein